MSLFENPIFVMTMGLNGTADIKELHEIAYELGLLEDWEIEKDQNRRRM
jgi:hypothetical protein